MPKAIYHTSQILHNSPWFYKLLQILTGKGGDKEVMAIEPSDEEKQAIATGVLSEARDIAKRTSGVVQKHCTTSDKMNSNLALLVLLILSVDLIRRSKISQTTLGQMLLKNLSDWQDTVTRVEVERILEERQ